MIAKELTSSSNVEIKFVRKIRKGSESHFIVEGKKLLTMALEADFHLESLWCSNSYPDQLEFLHGLANIPVRIVTQQLYEGLSPTRASKGPLGVFKRPEGSLGKFEMEKGRFLLLDSIQDPGNAGALVRAAAAFGMDGVIWSELRPDPFHHALIRSSAGSVFGIRQFSGDMEGLRKGPSLIGTSASRGTPLPEYCWPESLVLCLGNEGHGLCSAIEQLCRDFVYIPIQNNVESLNVAGAAHVLLYQMVSNQKPVNKRS